MEDKHQTGGNINPISVMKSEAQHLTDFAREYRSPMRDYTKCLIESLLILALDQDFIQTSRTDNMLLMDDM